MTVVRVAGPDDAAAYLRIRADIFPWQVGSLDGVRHSWQRMLDRPGGQIFTVDGAAGPVAFGLCSRKTWTSEPGACGVTVLVEEGSRRQGYGSALLAACEERLRAADGHRVQAWAKGEPESVSWGERRGYETTAEARFSRADLSQLPPMPELPAGVTTMTLAELGPDGTYAIDSATVVDEPSDMPMDQVEQSEWMRDIWNDPLQRFDLGTAVLVDGVPAAATFVEGDPAAGRMNSGGTGTLRAYRGRGLAKIAKSVALRNARAAGFTEAFTANDEVNGPMLAVNTWLGYRPVGSEVSLLRSLRR